MGTTVDLNEIISFLKSQNKRIVPITRVEAITVYEEIAALRAQLAEAQAQVERLRAVAVDSQVLIDFMATSNTRISGSMSVIEAGRKLVLRTRESLQAALAAGDLEE